MFVLLENNLIGKVFKSKFWDISCELHDLQFSYLFEDWNLYTGQSACCGHWFIFES